MRSLLVALALLIVLSGCAGPSGKSSADGASSSEGEGQEPLPLTGVLAPERKVMEFAGGGQEGSMPLQVTFTQTEACIFAADICGAAVKRVDLTPIIPPNVPVELSVELTGDGNYWVQPEMLDTTLVRYRQEYDAGTYHVDALLVRAASGTLGLTVQYTAPSVGSADAAVLDGLAHTIARADVVPAYIPAAVELGPGDTIRASGTGLEELLVIAPDGRAPLRAAAAPFNVTVPLGYPTGEYFVVAAADEAVKLRGPDRPLTARQLVFTETEPIDLPLGPEVTWEMPLASYPLVAGVIVQSKETTQGVAFASFRGNMRVTLTTPAGYDVIAEETPCTVLVSCSLALAGTMSQGWSSGLLDEHLVLGTYTGKVAMESGRDMQAYSWALTIG